MDYFYIAGIIGAICILIAFFLCNYKDWSSRTVADEWLNFIGSGLLLAYAIDGMVWPFIILNTVWALWSLKLLISYYKK